MSDGPYKTLPMRPKWRALSRRADNSAFTAEEVADSVCPALAGDWAAEVSPSSLQRLRALLEAGASPLFPDDLTSAVGRLRAGAETPMGTLLVEAACEAVNDGLTGQAALRQAANEALVEMALRGIRQVEEHWLRESPEKRAANVRARLEAAVVRAGISDLAERMLGGTGASEVRAEPKSGLDEGVTLER